MDIDRNGQIVTFYSYKGGTGRTMALANVAWILASKRQAGAGRRLGPGGARACTASSIRSSTTSCSAPPPAYRLDHRVRQGRDQHPAARGDGPDWHRAVRRRSSRARDVARLGRSRTAARWTSSRRAGRTATTRTRSARFDWDDFYDRLGGGALPRRAARRHAAQLRLRADRQPHRPQRYRRYLHGPPARTPGRLLHPQRPVHRRRGRGRPLDRRAHRDRDDPDPAGPDADRRGREGESSTPAGHWPGGSSTGYPRGLTEGRARALLGRRWRSRTGRSTPTRRPSPPSATSRGSANSLLSAFERLTGRRHRRARSLECPAVPEEVRQRCPAVPAAPAGRRPPTSSSATRRRTGCGPTGSARS